MSFLVEMIHGVPAWAIGPVCVLGFVVPAIVGLWLVHRKIHQRLKLGETLVDNGVVGWFFSGTLTIYGITLGLIAVTTWESSSRVADIASREAATIAALYRDTGGFERPLREELRGKLRDYTRFVIEKAWPAQRRGEIVNGGSQKLDAFQSQLFLNEPHTDGLKILQAEALKTYNELVELRRQRMDAVNQHVPGVVWAVILLGGALAIATSFCFHLQVFRFHLLLTTGLATMIGLLVFLIARPAVSRSGDCGTDRVPDCFGPRDVAEGKVVVVGALHKKSFCGRRLRRRSSATSHFGTCGNPLSRSETAPTEFLCKARG